MCVLCFRCLPLIDTLSTWLLVPMVSLIKSTYLLMGQQLMQCLFKSFLYDHDTYMQSAQAKVYDYEKNELWTKQQIQLDGINAAP